MIENLDITDILEEEDSPETRAYSHGLDLILEFMNEAERQGLTKKELAKRMGVSKSQLSNLLSSCGNLTLKTIAKFELALDCTLSFNLDKTVAFSSEQSIANEPTFYSAPSDTTSVFTQKVVGFKANPKHPNIFETIVAA